MQAHGNVTHVLTVNTAVQVSPSPPSILRPLQTLQKQPKKLITINDGQDIQMPEKHF